jgi:lipopolysaccharide biosynthesis glycosyltransferase
MNIVFACDMKYAQHLAVAMCSLFENHSSEELQVFLLNSDFRGKNWEALQFLSRKYGRKLVDVKVTDEEVGNLVTRFHYTKEMYYRLFIAEKLNCSKALYIDADVVVNGSLKAFYNTELDDCYLAGVVNPGFDRHQELGMSAHAGYFNSGVMLLNLPAWRRDSIKEQVIRVVEKRHLVVQYPDQCGLNAVVNGRWKKVHPRYNLQGCFFEKDAGKYAQCFGENELKAAIHNPAIIHFSGSNKPWLVRCKHPYRKLYWRFLRKTPFKRLLPSDMTIPNVVKWCVRKIS